MTRVKGDIPKRRAKAKACGQEIIKFVHGTIGILDRGMVEKNNENKLARLVIFWLLKYTHTNDINIFT